MIRIRNLSKQYGSIVAIRQLSMSIDKGVIFGLLGPNGAGKTTLISILNGLTGFQEGEIEIFGLPLTSPKELKQIRKRCAFVPQSLAFYENLSVIENLHFFAGIQQITGKTLQNNLDYAVSVNHLQPLLEQKAATLSGGQKRRLNIAVGLLNNPELLYFDEPTIGIDPESRNEILTTIRSFKEDNKTVIYTSHYMDEIEKICDQAAIINHGEIIRQGDLQSMLQERHDHSAIIELAHSDHPLPDILVESVEGLKIIDEDNLLLEEQNSNKMAKLLSILEEQKIAIKQIRYQQMTLESFFINLTSTDNSNA